MTYELKGWIHALKIGLAPLSARPRNVNGDIPNPACLLPIRPTCRRRRLLASLSRYFEPSRPIAKRCESKPVDLTEFARSVGQTPTRVSAHAHSAAAPASEFGSPMLPTCRRSAECVDRWVRS